MHASCSGLRCELVQVEHAWPNYIWNKCNRPPHREYRYQCPPIAALPYAEHHNLHMWMICRLSQRAYKNMKYKAGAPCYSWTIDFECDTNSECEFTAWSPTGNTRSRIITFAAYSMPSNLCHNPMCVFATDLVKHVPDCYRLFWHRKESVCIALDRLSHTTHTHILPYCHQLNSRIV